jgi:hypothetical protein
MILDTAHLPIARLQADGAEILAPALKVIYLPTLLNLLRFVSNTNCCSHQDMPVLASLNISKNNLSNFGEDTSGVIALIEALEVVCF